jgi:hypothetical protein
MAKSKKSKGRKSAKASSRSAARSKAVTRGKSAKKAKSAKPSRVKTAARKAPVHKAAPRKAVARKATRPAARPVPARRAPSARPAPAAPPTAIAPTMIVPTPLAPPPAPAAPAATPGSGGENGDAAEEEPQPSPEIREAVASFATHAQFREAVKRLLAAGFAPTDLSVLASHDSLEVAGGVPGYRGSPGASLMAGLTDEVQFLAPLQVAGFSALSGGPIAAAFAAAVTAGLGVAALGEVIDRFVANRHSADFAAALKAGAVLLWVRADSDQRAAALAILKDCGGANPHIHSRRPRRSIS